jgi:hypothetical protein
VSLVSSGTLTEFWKAEQRDYPSAAKVLVLEDAETLLSERGHLKRSPVAAVILKVVGWPRAYTPKWNSALRVNFSGYAMDQRKLMSAAPVP